MTNDTKDLVIDHFKIKNNKEGSPIDVRVQRHDGHIVNVEIKRTLEERRQALMYLNDQEMTEYNSTYTYLLQNAISESRAEIRDKLNQAKDQAEKEAYTYLISENAVQQRIDKYTNIFVWLDQLHEMSATFIQLEAFINNPFNNNSKADPQVSIEQLKEALTAYGEQIEPLLQKDNFESYSHSSILRHIDRYQIQLTALLGQDLSRAQVKHVVCVHDMDTRYVSLGRFIAEQQILLLDLALEVVSFDINRQRFREILSLPSWMQPLSDVRVALFLKANAASGSLYNNPYAPIPSTMLGAMTNTSALSHDQDEAKYLSVTPYIKKPLSPAAMDKALSHAIARPYHASYSHYFTNVFIGTPFEFFAILFITGPVRLLAGAWEIAWSILRITLVLLMGLVDLGLSMLGLNVHQPMTKLNQYLSQLYASPFLTPLSMLRRQKHHYQDQQAFDDKYQKLLDTCQESLGYCHQFFLLFTPEAITSSIRTFFNDLFEDVINVYRDIRYLTFYAQTSSVDSIADRIASQRSQIPQVEQANNDCFPLVDYIVANKTPAFVDIFYELIDVCSMRCIEPMFRQFKLPSALCFMGASIMFATCVPLIVAALPSGFKALLPMKIPAKYVAHLLINKSVDDPAVAFMGCQITWQIALAFCQLSRELITGRLEAFKPIFDEPEKYILGFASLVGLGAAIGYLPHLPEVFFKGCPNFYFSFLNAIRAETRGLINGSIVAKITTLPLVGAKGAMLTISMTEGSRHHLSADNYIENNKKTTAEIDAPAGSEQITDLHMSVHEELNIERVDRSIPTTLMSNPFSNEKEILLINKRAEIIRLAKLVAYVKPHKHATSEAHEEDTSETQKEDKVCFDVKNKEAYIYYNQLHRLLKEYNALVREQNDKQALQVDSQSYLKVFFNSYCDTGCNNFVRSTYFFIPVIYVAVLALRLWKLYKAYTQGQAVYAQDVSICFARDALIFAKLAIAIVIGLRAMFVALSCSFLVLSKLNLGIMACVAHLLYLPYRLFIELGYNNCVTTERVETQKLSTWLNNVDRVTDRYVPYFPPSVSFFRTACNQLAEKAGSLCDINAVTDNLILELNATI